MVDFIEHRLPQRGELGNVFLEGSLSALGLLWAVHFGQVLKTALELLADFGRHLGCEGHSSLRRHQVELLAVEVERVPGLVFAAPVVPHVGLDIGVRQIVQVLLVLVLAEQVLLELGACKFRGVLVDVLEVHIVRNFRLVLILSIGGLLSESDGGLLGEEHQ